MHDESHPENPAAEAIANSGLTGLPLLPVFTTFRSIPKVCATSSP